MSAIDQFIQYIRSSTTEETQVDLKQLLISAIIELTNDERKELLAMWKGRKIQ